MIFLREANNGSDIAVVMAWHSNPLIYGGFFTIRKPLTWEEHYRWWTQTTKDWKKFIIVLMDLETDVERPIGIIRISSLEDFSPQFGLTIGEVSLWGKGYGTQAVEIALEWLKGRGYHHTHTSVLKSNKRALKLLKNLGFKEYGEAREGEVWVQRKL